MANNSRNFQDPFRSLQMHKDEYQGQLGDDSFAFDAAAGYGPLMTEFLSDYLPLSTNQPTLFQNPLGSSANIAKKAQQLNPTQSPWNGTLDPTTYEIYPSGIPDTLEQSMLDSMSVLSDGNTFAESLTSNSLTRLSPRQDKSASVDLRQLQTLMNSQLPRFPKDNKCGDHLANDTAKAKLIEGEVVLQLLFKYISKPTMDDIEGIADDTGYSFEFVIESYCQYRNNIKPDVSAFKGFGATTDSAYSVEIERPTCKNAKPLAKRVRLNGSSDPEPAQPLANRPGSKIHRCPKCNESFRRQSDVNRHYKIHARGEFDCPYSGCGKVFSRKDKLNEHWRRMHDDKISLTSKSSQKRDDSDNDPNFEGRQSPNNSFTREGSSQNSRNSAGSANSALSGQSNSFGNVYSLSASLRYESLFIDNLSTAKTELKLATWEVVRKLGHGGCASVYELSVHCGIDSKDRKAVASKIIKLPKDYYDQVLRRAQNEIGILQLLDHPHIIKLAGSFALADRVFINTFPVADCTLTQFLKIQTLPISSFTKGRIWEQLCGVASAVAHIHNYESSNGHAGYHLDIKPDNILVMLDAESKSPSRFLLSDFGSAVIAPLISPISCQNRAVTPKYCAPEFAKSGEIGQAYDVWSLGCVFAEVLTYLHDRTMRDFETFRFQRIKVECRWKYNEVLPVLNDWLRLLSTIHRNLAHGVVQDDHYVLIAEMLRPNSFERPFAAEVVGRLRITKDVQIKLPCVAPKVIITREHDLPDNKITKEFLTDFSAHEAEIPGSATVYRNPTFCIPDDKVAPFSAHSDLCKSQNDYGIHSLYRPDSKVANVDIVVVHGITGSGKSTWLQGTDCIRWLGGLLPNALPEARIFKYGYDSSIIPFAKVGYEAAMQETAQHMLESLCRQREQEKSRPIIFICHSMGGLVVKKALLNSEKDPQLSSIFKATSGIAFISTPNRETSPVSTTPFERILETAQEPVIDDPEECSISDSHRKKAKSLRKGCDMALPSAESLYPPLSPKQRFKLLLPLVNDRSSYIAGIPATIVPMMGNYLHRLTRVLHNMLSPILRKNCLDEATGSLNTHKKRILLESNCLSIPSNGEF